MVHAPIEDASEAALRAAPHPPGWLERRLPVSALIRREYVVYPIPANLNWLWNIGACITATLALLVVTGVFLSLEYSNEPDRAFLSVENIDRHVPWGWLLRALHMAGATAIFLGLAIHTWRSLYYGSYKRPRELVWITGTLLLLVVMAASFLGYVLPWGQMSYWGLVVADHALRSVPGVGDTLAGLLIGGDAPGAATLHRAFALHVLLGLAAPLAVVLHLSTLHAVGSNNPAGIDPPPEGEHAFYPSHAARTGLAAGWWLMLVVFLACFLPGWLTDSENYLAADPTHTPMTVAPPWYFLPFYAILRAVPGASGVLLAVASVLVLFALPWLDRDPRRALRGRPVFRLSVLLLIPVVLLLGFAGAEQTRGAWLTVARLATVAWFAHPLLVLPCAGRGGRAFAR